MKYSKTICNLNMAIGIGRLIKRYCLVTLVPAFVVTSIYADYSRTQLYKAKLKRDHVSDYS
ncbi:hypothetical protein NQ314_001306 [Rhamnusium bicolor]|uniref:Uncharacterized protein n=1 Tax=Rhamnusium bicolor TaxID=1586634 RepID=A0AAV8ZSI5_9CUCU|nr:hypothetical protein NQ314_001306 [Rhamnusium bicolor]